MSYHQGHHVFVQFMYKSLLIIHCGNFLPLCLTNIHVATEMHCANTKHTVFPNIYFYKKNKKERKAAES